MKIQHLIMSILLAAIWGFNFVVIKFGLKFIPPLLFSFIRFFLVSMPAIFFIKPPAVPIKLIAVYGITAFALQFALLFLGINMGVTAGIASLLFQVQVFFSIFLAIIFLKETINIQQIIGSIIAFFGIILIGMNLSGDVSLIGFVLILTSAAAWGTGSIMSKKFNTSNFIGLVVWGGLFAWPLLLLMSIIFEGTEQIINSFYQHNYISMLAIVYIAYIATFLGFYIWNILLSKYPVSTIAPFCLLVPIFGMVSSILLLDETLDWWKIVATCLIISGLYINSYFATKPG